MIGVMYPQLIEDIHVASSLSVFIPLAFYLRGIRSFPIQNHLIGLLIIVSAVIDLITFFDPSPVLNNVFNITQFGILTFFFFLLVYKKKAEPVLLVAIGIYAAGLIYHVVTVGLSVGHSYLWSLASLILMMHAVTYFANVSNMVIDRYFDPNLFSNLIFSASIFIYFLVLFSVSLLLEAVVQLSQDMQTVKGFWAIHNIFNILKNVGFAWAFYYTGKRKIYMTLSQLEQIAKKLEEETDTKS
jgi:hypothetical protein